MVQYDRNSPNGPKQSKLVQSGLKWIGEGSTMDQKRFLWTKRSKMDKMVQNGLKWSKLAQEQTD